MSEGKRLLFILTPFRNELEPVVQAVVEVAEVMGFEGYTSKDREVGGNLIKTIVEGIYQADLVVADLTYANPNVLYELGVAHALWKNSIMICQKRSGLMDDI